MKVNYKLKSGVALHEAIDDGNVEQTVKCLISCYEELLFILDEEDREWKEFDIEDTIFNLINFDPDEDVDDYLEYFYYLCDELHVWICTLNEEV